jgi:hypothetical protein
VAGQAVAGGLQPLADEQGRRLAEVARSGQHLVGHLFGGAFLMLDQNENSRHRVTLPDLR